MTNTLPLLTVTTADWVFGGILSLLSLILILLAALALRRRAERRRTPAAPAPAESPVPAPPPAAAVYPPAAAGEAWEGLMGSLTRGEEKEPKAEPARAERPLDEKSIDKHFAEHHGRWICRYCETINDRGMVLCQACGQPRN